MSPIPEMLEKFNQKKKKNMWRKKNTKFIGFANRDFLINTVIYLLFSFTKNRNDAAELI